MNNAPKSLAGRSSLLLAALLIALVRPNFGSRLFRGVEKSLGHLARKRGLAVLAVILPTASRGIFGGIVLGFGRALGETMALAMLVGNSNQLSLSMFSPANTLAALLANNFPEAGARQIGVLMYAALVLLGITLVVNVIGALIIERASLARVD